MAGELFGTGAPVLILNTAIFPSRGNPSITFPSGKTPSSHSINSESPSPTRKQALPRLVLITLMLGWL